jgi:Zn-finger nucleic acid-binding protein
MNNKETERRSAAEVQFELKYCERCGGLWLRPMRGEQIYCGACWSEMKKLPPVSHRAESTRVPKEPRWYGDRAEFEGYEEDEKLDLEAGGVA